MATEDDGKPGPTSLFPLFPSASGADSGGETRRDVKESTAGNNNNLVQSFSSFSAPPQWLSNTSFTADVSVINNAVASQYGMRMKKAQSDEDDDDEDEVRRSESRQSPKYGLVESSEGDSDAERRERRRRRTKMRKRSRRSEGSEAASNSFAARKSTVQFLGVKGGSAFESVSGKDYYFDSRGDRDNLAFGSLYRMDVARYKHCATVGICGTNFGLPKFRHWKSSILDIDGDVDQLESKLKSSGRYWSPKYTALERHKNLRRLRILASKKPNTSCQAEHYVPLADVTNSSKGGDAGTIEDKLYVEESWEDEVLRKTKEFSVMTREHPHNEQAWLAFAEFQDKVASMQPQKGARLQTLEKKISILEKAVELNPENEELLLRLLQTYYNRDSPDVLIGRWEKVLVDHSSSYKLWNEFLHVIQQDFSRFKVSDTRKIYIHAIQALSSACTRQHRQGAHPATLLSEDPTLIQLELGLVDIFVSLCRFESQTGYQELSTALFQAELEYSIFCPPLSLSDKSKQRLFEHFWNSHGARIGEEGAVGWSVWLEKQEEHRQQLNREEIKLENESGGWTGWSEPLSKDQTVNTSTENAYTVDMGVDDEPEKEDTNQEDDTEALLKMLGINASDHDNAEVNDTSTWARWSMEESSRDSNQWLPIRPRNEKEFTGATADIEADEHLMRVVLFEDISEYIFSLNSSEARLSLVYQFIDFFGGHISQQICTNSSSWSEKISTLETVPESISLELQSVHDALALKRSHSDGFDIGSLLSSEEDVPRKTDMMQFLRNATLLCLTVLPRNSTLEEAALRAEELFHTKMNTCTYPTTPCRTLAKFLLKQDRQDILLCGVYAQREAAFGNIDHARKVFDMALSSVEVLPPELKCTASLLFYWYADMELVNYTDDNSYLRAMHILSCLGSGVAYSPFKTPPSAPQLLRARQGFRDQIRNLRSKWVHGVVDDPSIALICSAALFEELTTGSNAASEVFNHAFSLVFPERRRQSHQLEHMFYYYLKMLQSQRKSFGVLKLWETILHGLQLYPCSAKLFRNLVEISHLYTVPYKLRRIFDDLSFKKPSVVLWLFAICYEISIGGSQHRIHGLFEKALANDQFHKSVLLWRWYIDYQVNVAGDLSTAKRIFFRAIHTCPWSKRLWLDGFLKLNSILTAREMSDLQEVMRDKELNLRTDIYEILLQADITL